MIKRHGGYGFRADLGPDPATGKRRQLNRQGFRTRREAEAALEEALGAARSGSAVSRSAMTLGQYLDEWLAGERQRLKETSWASYRIAVARVKAHMGRTKLQALSAAGCRTLLPGPR